MQQSEQRMGKHLKKTNKPKTQYKRSYDEYELLAVLKEKEMPAKPILLATLKSRQQWDNELGSI
jgi:hypothetical protein